MALVSALRRRLAAFWHTQVRLWEAHGRRHELSGRETRAALRGPAPLRWSGGALRGDVLPP